MSVQFAYDQALARPLALDRPRASLVSLGSFAESLRQNMVLVCLIIATVVSLTFAGRLANPPFYPASVQLYIDPAQLDLVAQRPETEGGVDAEPEELKRFRIMSVAHHFTATPVLRAVVDRLQLDTDPEFVGGGAFGAVKRMITGESIARNTDRAVETLRTRVGAEASLTSFVVTLSVLSTDAQKAGRIADSLAQEVVRSSQQAKQARYEAARGQIDKGRAEVEKSVRALGQESEQRRSAAGMAGLGRDTVLEQDYGALAASLSEAESKRLAAESRYQSALAAKDGGLDFAGGTQAAPALDALRQQVITARRESLAAGSGDLPTARAARARLAAAEETYKAEATRTLAAARFERDAAKASEENLRRQFEARRTEVLSQRKAGVSVELAARDERSLAAVARDLDAASGRAEARASADDKQTRILGPASLSLTPWRVTPMKAAVLSGFAGLLVGLAVVILRARPTAGGAAINAFDMSREPLFRYGVPFYVALTVIMTTAAFYPLMAGAAAEGDVAAGQTATAAGNPIYLLLWMGLYGLTGLIILRDAFLRGIERNIWPGLLLIAYLIVSSLWAERPSTALYFGILLAINVIMAYALAQIAVPQVTLRLIGYTLGTLILLSFVYLVVSPGKALSWSDGRGWFIPKELSGLFSHKVHMGTYSAMALVVALYDSVRFRLNGWRLAVILGSIVGMALANSATAVAAGFLTALTLYAARSSREAPYRWLYGLFAACFAFSVLAPVINLGALTMLLGRDANLTGRGSFWTLAWPLASERPFGGHGYTTFFDLGPFSPVWAIYKDAQYFFTPNFHNSSLDTVVSFGVPGLFGYIMMVLTAGLAVFNRSIVPHARVLLIGLLMMFAISSSFDFQFMRHNGMPSLLLFYLLFLAGKDVRPSPA